MDSAYDGFIKFSEKYLVKAFRSYLIALWLFLFEIALTSAEQMDFIRYPYLMVFSIIAFFFYKDWSSVMTSAAQIYAETETEIDKSK